MAKKKTKKNYYVAYGSNMNLEQMRWRCPLSVPIGKAYLKGYKLVFNIHADIIPTGDDKDVLPVALWDINPSEWGRLDMYEGYPKYYTREKVNVITEDGELVEATVYVMTKERKGIAPPAATYFYGIVQGCEDFGITPNHIMKAVRESVKNPTEYNQYNPCKASKAVV